MKKEELRMKNEEIRHCSFLTAWVVVGVEGAASVERQMQLLPKLLLIPALQHCSIAHHAQPLQWMQSQCF
jgi:hypothetical protein